MPIISIPEAYIKNGRKPVMTSVRLCYNELTSLDNLAEHLSHIMDDPRSNLQWLDVSFNQLTRIDSVLLQFPNLQCLYMHGNKIRSVLEVKKLGQLSKLTKLTLHGNTWTQPQKSAATGVIGDEKAIPADSTAQSSSVGTAVNSSGHGGAGADLTQVAKKVKRLEESKFYRESIVWYLRDTMLKQLDFNSITPKDRESAIIWNNSKVAVSKKKESEELKEE
jgi:Leucine-rich repeat (LRR) protein